MPEFILASGNAHKAQEFAELFVGKLAIKAAPRGLAPDETGATYLENALIKARAYYEEFKVPALADDSGLTITALPEILGVQSARFLPEKTEYKDKCTELLKILGPERTNREAYFTCVLCFYLSPTEIYFFEGRVQGKIGLEYKGDYGFGYDPIFIPLRNENDGKSLAELPEWKNLHSHRARAAKEALTFFNPKPIA